MLPLVALIKLSTEDSSKRFADESSLDSWLNRFTAWLCEPIDFPGKWPAHEQRSTTYNSEIESMSQQPAERP